MNSKNNSTTIKKDYLLQYFVNIGTVVVFFVIVVIIYKFFIKNDNIYSNFLDYKDKETQIKNNENFTNSTNPINTSKTDTTNIKTNSIYESSLQEIYGNNKRLLCNILPTLNENSTVCKIDNIPYIKYKFPIHLLKLNDGSILAVFNDGRLYQKDSILSTLWKGPIKNSMPLGTVPLRMITLSTDLKTLLGVGYNNILYVKTPQSNSDGGDIDISGSWKQVPNNSNIIYVVFDNVTNYLISIDINGKLFTKSSSDLTSTNKELRTLLDRPVLRVYYDLNGYMLVIDNKFDLYQFTDIDWKTTPLQITRGANPNKLQDILYDNDGKLYGLVFNTESFIVQIMKQNIVYYLADFKPLDMLINDSTKLNFVMSDQDILKCKIGSLYEYININSIEDTNDDDPNFALQKQILQSKGDLAQFCANRGANTQNINYDNYELLANVENNNDKISKLKNIIDNLMTYEPERMNIQEKYSILNK